MLKKNCRFRCISALRCLSVTTHENSLMWWVRSYESSSRVINCHCCGKSIRRESGGKFRNEVIIPHRVVLFHVHRRSSSPPASVGKAKQSEVNLLSFPNRKNDGKYWSCWYNGNKNITNRKVRQVVLYGMFAQHRNCIHCQYISMLFLL